MMKRWIGLVAFLAISQVQAASFDCAKARTKIEKLICANEELSKLDEALAAAYAVALKSPDPTILKAEHQAWLKLRSTCMDVTCIKRAYENRLRAVSTTIAQSLPASAMSDGIALSGSFVPNPNCVKPMNDAWQRQCYPPDMAKLETELAQVYSATLSHVKEQDKTRQDQQIWIKERNECAKAWSPRLCLDYVYRKRIVQLRYALSPQEPAEPMPGKPKGEFFLSRTYDTSTSFCQDFTRNLNQFRHLDYGECNPRLSPKFPEFSRPNWEEIPFDLGVAEQVVRRGSGTEDWREKFWRLWLANSGALRKAGQIRLWRLRIDIDGDGKMDTVIRIDPMPGEIASLMGPVSQKPPSPYGCEYNFGSLFMLSDATTYPDTARDFNRAYFQDIIFNAANNNYYLVSWSPEYRADGLLGISGDTADIGATAGVTLASLRGWPISYLGDKCKIDWVLTGRYKPPKRLPARN
jgi:uncharacterized protein